MIKVSLPEVETQLRPRITVFGVGGAGGNAVNNMIRSNLEGVDFVVANTDAQALNNSLAPRQIQLGTTITRGLGAGSRPDVGRAAAEEQYQDILSHLEGANMVFITGGMGGGTGTGAAPVIARVAREQGILTVGVVTKPFHFEGAHRMRLAESGIGELQQYVDTLIIIPNQNLFRIANEKTTFADAFKMADDVLHSGVRGVTDLMVMPGLINLDFADIRSVMTEMGKAMMGTGEATGESRSIHAAEAAISNPLLDDVSMKGARGVLINITGGLDMTLFEVDEAANRIRDEVDPDANIIFGSTFDESMEGRMRVSVVATGIDAALISQQRAHHAQAQTQAAGSSPAGGPASFGGIRKPAHPPVPPASAAARGEGYHPAPGYMAGLVQAPLPAQAGAAMGAASATPAASAPIQPMAHHPAAAMPVSQAATARAIQPEPVDDYSTPPAAMSYEMPAAAGEGGRPGHDAGAGRHSQSRTTERGERSERNERGERSERSERSERAERKDDVFIAPRPAEAGPRPSSAQSEGYRPMPASSAAASGAARKSSSFLDRFNVFSSRRSGSESGAGDSQGAAAPQSRSPASSGIPTRPSASASAAPRGNESAGRRNGGSEEDFDIPAFLRRGN